MGDPGLCRGRAFYDFLRVALQITPMKLLSGVCDGQAIYDFLRVDLQISPMKLLSAVCPEQAFYDFVRVHLQISPIKSLNEVGHGQPFYDFWKSPFTPYGGLGGRLYAAPRSGSDALSSRARVTWLVRVDRQKLVFF